MAISISTAARNAAAAAVAALVDGGSGAGYIEIRTGGKPATPATAASGDLLATVTLADPAFGSPASGVVTAAGVPKTGAGVDDGTAGWFRLYDSAAVAILDGTAGTSGTDLVLAAATIATGVTVSITAMTITMPAS